MKNIETAGSVTLMIDGKEVQLPYYKGAEGKAIDISDLPDGVTTLDPKLSKTALKLDKTCFIDGGNGRLFLAGRSIESLLENEFTLQEVALLLRDAMMPNTSQTQVFGKTIKRNSIPLNYVWKMLKAMPRETKPMAMLGAILPTLDEDWGDLTDSEIRNGMLPVTMARMSTVVAMIYRYLQGEQDFIEPRQDVGFVRNFLYMCNGKLPSEEEVNFYRTFAVLHCEHGMNGSTFTTMATSGTLAQPFASIASGVNALAGSRHGGANQDVVLMFMEAVKDGVTAEELVSRAERKEIKIPGIGHNVYKAFDPRAGVFKAMAERELTESDDPVVKLGFETYEKVRESKYFQDRKLYANVDYFSAFLLLNRGVPVSMFPVLFAWARVVGWTIHWAQVPSLIRPRSLYVGELEE